MAALRKRAERGGVATAAAAGSGLWSHQREKGAAAAAGRRLQSQGQKPVDIMAVFMALFVGFAPDCAPLYL